MLCGQHESLEYQWPGTRNTHSQSAATFLDCISFLEKNNNPERCLPPCPCPCPCPYPSPNGYLQIRGALKAGYINALPDRANTNCFRPEHAPGKEEVHDHKHDSFNRQNPMTSSVRERLFPCFKDQKSFRGPTIQSAKSKSTTQAHKGLWSGKNHARAFFKLPIVESAVKFGRWSHDLAMSR